MNSPMAMVGLGLAAFFVLIAILSLLSRNRVSKKIPSARPELTTYLKANFAAVKRAKVHGRGSAWTRALGRKICEVGIETAELTVDQKFAALFLVNFHFHRGLNGAEEKKNFIQRTIVVHHRREITLLKVNGGKYAGTYELKYGPWSSHVPVAVVEGGALERPGKPAAHTKFDKARGGQDNRRRW